MVVKPILAYFLNNMPNSVFFFLKVEILYLYNIYKIIQFFIWLLDSQAFILNIICEGNRSLNLPSTPSRLTFVHPLSSFHHHLCPPPTTVCPQPHPTTWEQAPPLHWEMWAKPPTLLLPHKRGCSPSPPSSFQRDVGSLQLFDTDSLREKYEAETGSRRAPWYIIQTNHGFGHGSFLPIPFSQPHWHKTHNHGHSCQCIGPNDDNKDAKTMMELNTDNKDPTRMRRTQPKPTIRTQQW